ncbi:hypothetical protein [uncultured Roseobacter sp.]|uniref:hypothetical protein n=1 Tax=uncultured Roseobacter sp. TaxID=114847 RepID=UPI0026079629|nr:hypothetical protein [uncultured Roseobacter sp.]
MSIAEIFSPVWAFIGSVPNLLPITVLGAVALFLVKETLEGIRRRNATKRKRRAMRRMLKDELERNKWALRSLRNSVNMVESLLQRPLATISLRTDRLGGRKIRLQEDGDGAYSERPLPEIHSDFIKENVLEIALVDKKIFEEALAVLDALAEMEHVLKGVLDYSESQDMGFLKGFAEYAHKELDDCETALANLYTKITGKPYEEFRLR